MNGTPAPDTCSPGMASHADSVRGMLERHDAIKYKEPAPRYAWEYPDGTEAEVKTLIIRKAWGAAPYVGPAFIYVWKVAMGADGEWIAGPSRIVYEDASWMYQ